MYVALSRKKSLENLIFIERYTAHAIKEIVVAKLEYERMSNNQMKFLPKLMISDLSLIITLLNICSIKMHMIDVLSDNHLTESVFSYLAEAQLRRHDHLDQTKLIFNEQFKIEFKINEDQHKNIVVCSKDDLSITNHVKLNGISGIQYQKVLLQIS